MVSLRQVPSSKTKSVVVVAALLCGLTLFNGRASGEEKIKLGTMAPSGSAWHTLLKEMGQKWSEASNGQVKLIIYPGGQLGGEGDMVKKMRVGQLQAVAVTTVGLHEITNEPQAISVPMLVDSFATLDYVMEHVGPRLEKALLNKGYVTIGWSEVGFVRFFSTKKFASMAEFIQNAKVFGWEGDPASIAAWRAGGFKPVVMSATDIVPSLQTGLLDTVALAPLYAFTSRMFERAKYMIDVPWAVLTGATIVKKEVWQKIPADVQTKLQAISTEYGKKIATEVRRMDTEALDTMKKQGLEVVHMADEAVFQKAATQTYAAIRGKVVPADLFDEIKKLVEESHKKGGK